MCFKSDNYNLRIVNIINNYKNVLYKNPNINGFGRGLKQINGIYTHKPCLTIYVEKKLSPSSLNLNQIIPKQFHGIQTDIIETGKINLFTSAINTPKLESNLLSRASAGGDLVRNINNTDLIGTLTCAVTDKSTNKLLLLLGTNTALARYKKDNVETILGTGRRGDILEIGHTHSSGKSILWQKSATLVNIAPIKWSESKTAAVSSPFSINGVIAAMHEGFYDDDKTKTFTNIENNKENQEKYLTPGLNDKTSLVNVKKAEINKPLFVKNNLGKRISGLVVESDSNLIIRRTLNGTNYFCGFTDLFSIQPSNTTDTIIQGDSGALAYTETQGGFIGVGLVLCSSMSRIFFTDLQKTLDFFDVRLLTGK